MKNAKKIAIAAALSLSMTVIQGPFFSETVSFAQEEVAIESVIESMTDNLTVEVGQSDSIGFTINEGTTGTVITWTSSNPSVASVDSVGTVTGMSPGSATITAVLGGSVKTCNVTVNESSINVNGNGAVEEPDQTVNDETDDTETEEIPVDDTEEEDDVEIDNSKKNKKDDSKKDDSKKTKIVVDPSNNASGSDSSSGGTTVTSTTSSKKSAKNETPKTADPTASTAVLFAGLAALFGAVGLKKYRDSGMAR